jgi:hypothetical protein
MEMVNVAGVAPDEEVTESQFAPLAAATVDGTAASPGP